MVTPTASALEAPLKGSSIKSTRRPSQGGWIIQHRGRISTRFRSWYWKDGLRCMESKDYFLPPQICGCLHVLWFSKDSRLHTETLACMYSDTTKDKLLLHLLHTHWCMLELVSESCCVCQQRREGERREGKGVAVARTWQLEPSATQPYI